jgi:hypothetical protein|tara:strand:- start:372 stop:851 length:480 start_codon:yes stop_codon:yes gene_type:complete
MTNTIEKLTNLNLASDAMATLTYEDGTDVFIHNESEIETALSETDVVEQFSELIATRGLRAQDTYTGNLVLDTLRSEDHLEAYERGNESGFAEYLTGVINENFYDLDLIDSATEKYDHKRGFTTLTATVSVPVQNLINTSPSLSSWNVEVQTENGTLKL